MGLSSAQLGRSWGAFGLSWVPLRCLLASFWVLLGCSWSHLGSHRRLCARFWMVLGASWLGFGELWGSFRYNFRRRCANCCRDPSMAFTLAFRYLLAARRYVRSTWNWSQVGSFWPKKTSGLGHFYLLKLNILKNSVLEGPGLDFRGPGS